MPGNIVMIKEKGNNPSNDPGGTPATKKFFFIFKFSHKVVYKKL